MYCKVCGTRNDDQAKFCNSCGAELLLPEQPKEEEKPKLKLENQWQLPGIILTLIAFALAIFPYQGVFNQRIGVEWWMLLLIFAFAFLALLVTERAKKKDKEFKRRFGQDSSNWLSTTCYWLCRLTLALTAMILFTKF